MCVCIYIYHNISTRRYTRTTATGTAKATWGTRASSASSGDTSATPYARISSCRNGVLRGAPSYAAAPMNAPCSTKSKEPW